MSLRVKNLTVYYQTLRGDVRALEDATFTVGDGEIMGLAGESGCGKSTLCNGLILLKPPMKLVNRCVTLDGEELPVWDMERMNEFRFKKISIIPQYAMNAMNPTRKIGKMTAELLESRKVAFKPLLPELKRRLDLVKLPHDVLDMYPIELSCGMKQRMVMVLSTLLDPKLLIADEITSALDVSTQKAVAEMLVEFRNRGCCKSVIVITHDLSLAHYISERAVILYRGCVVEMGATDKIFDQPLHPYTKMLMASVPRLDKKWQAAEAELKAQPSGRGDGCVYYERCSIQEPDCTQERPMLVDVNSDHSVACCGYKI